MNRYMGDTSTLHVQHNMHVYIAPYPSNNVSVLRLRASSSYETLQGENTCWCVSESLIRQFGTPGGCFLTFSKLLLLFPVSMSVTVMMYVWWCTNRYTSSAINFTISVSQCDIYFSKEVYMIWQVHYCIYFIKDSDVLYFLLKSIRCLPHVTQLCTSFACWR